MTQLGPKATRIANAIVDLVERTDGGITLLQVENEIPGFRSRGGESLNWDLHVTPTHPEDKECVFWDGMSKAGMKALENVIYAHRVAIQFVGVLNYLVEGDPPSTDNWVPIVLLPVKGANVYTPKLLMRVPEALLVAKNMKPGWRPLTPQPLKFDADLTPLFTKKRPNTETTDALVGQ